MDSTTRFVRRRVHPTHAEDVVGDVMLFAWRRLDGTLSATRAWLFGHRGLGRQQPVRRVVAVQRAELRSPG